MGTTLPVIKFEVASTNFALRKVKGSCEALSALQSFVIFACLCFKSEKERGAENETPSLSFPSCLRGFDCLRQLQISEAITAGCRSTVELAFPMTFLMAVPASCGGLRRVATARLLPMAPRE